MGLLFDFLHYLIGFIIVGFLLYLIILSHNYFSKDNNSIDQILTSSKIVL